MTTAAGGEEQFGKFILLKKLGAGAMAEVFLAEETGPAGFAKLVAVKRILPHLADQQDFVTSLAGEARTGASLNHPNVVQTLEFGKEGTHYFLALEYVPGITLSDLLRHRRENKAPLPLKVALDIAQQLCAGLSYAHEATSPRGLSLNMIHRDLKPSNILLSDFGIAKISDFGIAKARTNLLQTSSFGQVKGTVAYMSPEQALSERLDHRSDLYSLGAILFELLTLERLYPNAGGLPGMALVARGEIADRLQRLPPLNAPLLALVRRILSRNRDDRPSSAAEVGAALKRIADPLPAGFPTLDTLVHDVRETAAGSVEHTAPPNSPLAGGPDATRQTSSEVPVEMTPETVRQTQDGPADPEAETGGQTHRKAPSDNASFDMNPSPSDGPLVGESPRRHRNRPFWTVITLLLIAGLLSWLSQQNRLDSSEPQPIAGLTRSIAPDTHDVPSPGPPSPTRSPAAAESTPPKTPVRDAPHTFSKAVSQTARQTEKRTTRATPPAPAYDPAPEHPQAETQNALSAPLSVVLLLNSKPSAEVHVDGKHLGSTSSGHLSLTVTEGSHLIVYTLEGEGGAQVGGGGSTKERGALEKRLFTAAGQHWTCLARFREQNVGCRQRSAE